MTERVDTVREESEWEETVVTTTAAASVAAPPSVVSGFSKVSSDETTQSDMPVAVVSGKCKDLMEIIKELDEYFLRAADSGGMLSALLEVPKCMFSDQQSSGNMMLF